jgi:hypothetical protein
MPTLYLRTGMLGGTTLDNNTKKRISPLSQSLFIERYVMKPVLIYMEAGLARLVRQPDKWDEFI